MAKVGYIMATSQYDKLEEDRKWMNEFGCVRIIEESDDNERHRPLWKQLMAALQRGDELVIPKFSNALRGSRELAIFLEFCRVKVIRIISIHDRIDSSNILFPETKPSDVFGNDGFPARRSPCTQEISRACNQAAGEDDRVPASCFCQQDAEARQREDYSEPLCGRTSDRGNLESQRIQKQKLRFPHSQQARNQTE